LIDLFHLKLTYPIMCCPAEWARQSWNPV